MRVGELLRQVAEQGVNLRCEQAEDRLLFSLAGALPANLLAELKEHKPEVIRILREDEEYHRTGVIRCERQVFELTRTHFAKDGGG